jgi:vesicle-fusing ATPase
MSTCISFLIEGGPGKGITAFATDLALHGDFSYIKFVNASLFIRRGEEGSASGMLGIFEDAHKSELSAIILDDVDRIIDYSSTGPRFSNRMLQALLVLLKSFESKLSPCTTAKLQFL